MAIQSGGGRFFLCAHPLSPLARRNPSFPRTRAGTPCLRGFEEERDS
jgi:hypothetical protein